MNIEERLTTATESMGIISNRLRELSNLINTVHFGLTGRESNSQLGLRS